MTGFALLDVGIGVIFAFLTFSLIASTMQEALASIFNWRGRMLRRGMFRLLESGAKSSELISKTVISGSIEKAELTLDLLNDPAMRSLQGSKSFLGRIWDYVVDRWNRFTKAEKFRTAETAYNKLKLKEKPSFQAALTDAATTPEFDAQVKDAIPDDEILRSVKAKGQGRMPGNVPKETFARSLLDTLYRKIEKKVAAEVAETKGRLKGHIEDAQAQILGLLQDAETVAKSARDAAAKMAANPSAGDDPQTLSDDLLREAMILVQPSAAYAQAYMVEIAKAADTAIEGVSGVIQALPMSQDLKARVTNALKAIAVTRALESEIVKIEDLATGAAAEVTKQIKRLEDEIARVTAEIGDWFDNGMDRVTGWYVRRAKNVLFLLGFLMAMIANFDIIGYAGQLLKDEELRSRMVTQAQTAAAAEAVGGLQVQNQSDLILAVLLTNTENREDPTITADEIWEQFDKLPTGARTQLGLDSIAEKPADAAAAEVTKNELKPALDKAAETLTGVAKTMVGAFPVDEEGDGIDDGDRRKAAEAYVENLRQTYGEAVGVLQTQFTDQGVKMGRVCPVQETKEEDLEKPSNDARWRTHFEYDKALIRRFVDRVFWSNSLGQCIYLSWQWQAFFSWLLIGLGCTFGGQFWFDLLKNLLKVRTASSGLNSDLKKLMGNQADNENNSGQSAAPKTAP